MRWLTLCISLLALSCFGQAYTFRDTAFMGVARPVAAAPASWNPTNVPGAPVYAGYVGSDYSTNPVSVWTDLSGNGFHLYSQISDRFNLESLNGIQVLGGGVGTKYLTNSAITLTQPLEIFAVVRAHNTNDPPAYFFSCTNDPAFGNFRIYYDGNANSLNSAMASGVGCGAGTPTTNQWQVWEFRFNSTTSTNYINNIAVGDGDAGSASAQGFIVNAYNVGGAALGHMDIAELFIYTNLLTRAQATSNYNYWVTKYGL